MTTDRVIYPVNIENEQTVLGYLFADNALFWKVNSFLREKHFSLPIHQRIFRAFGEAINLGIVTPLTLKAQFDADDDLSDTGGSVYLSKLWGMAIWPAFDIETSAMEMIDLARRRDLIDLGIQLTQEAQDLSSDKDVGSIAASVLSVASDIIGDTRATSFKSGYHIINDIMEALDKPVECYSSGIGGLDKSTDGGFYPGYVYSFGGKPKTGKTIVGTTIAGNLAMADVKVGYLTLEMSKEAIMSRILCRYAQIHPKTLKGRERDVSALKGRIISTEDITKLKNLIVCYEPSMTFEALKQRLHYLVHRAKIKGFVLDYWQTVGGVAKHKTEASHLSDVAQWLSAFCKKENVFGIVLLQQNEDGTLFMSRGINRATEQLYNIHRCGNNGEKMCFEMEFSRYSEPANVGDLQNPAFNIIGQGPYLQEIKNGERNSEIPTYDRYDS